MKRILANLILISFLAVPVLVSAQVAGPVTPPSTPVMVILNNLTNWLFGILLVIAAIAIIVAAYFFVTAAGDPDKTKKARDFVLYALIGVLVAFAAKGLIMLVETIGRV